MPKLAVWTFALFTVLFPSGRAQAKPRVEPVALKGSESAEPASQDSGREKKRTAKSVVTPESSRTKQAKRGKATAREAKKAKPCFSPQVHVARRRGDVLEHRDLSLTFCDGRPNPAAVDSVSVLARPRDAERPLMPEIRAYQRRPLDRGPLAKRRRPDYLSEHVMRVHNDLLTRLQKVALRFPGKTIEIVSGHRPDARDTSRHHHGRALDIRVDGVSREVLRDFLRSMDETGVGYYPNSYFVHMDVRDKRGYWVDRSGPGERADYGTWPPTRREVESATDSVLARAMHDLATLGEGVKEVRELGFAAKTKDSEIDTAPAEDVPASETEAHEELAVETLTRDEVARIRAEALQALEAL